jgi:hypothetical protein
MIPAKPAMVIGQEYFIIFFQSSQEKYFILAINNSCDNIKNVIELATRLATKT